MSVRQNGSWSVKKKIQRSPRRVAERTPRPQVRWLSYARRRALPLCGSDNPRRKKLYTLQGMKMGRRARRDGGAEMGVVSGDAVRGFLAFLFPGFIVAMTATCAILRRFYNPHLNGFS